MKTEMKKRLSMLLMVCMLAGMLAGCGGSDADRKEDAENESQTSSEMLGGGSENQEESSESENKTFTMVAGIGALDWTYYENPPFMYACEQAGISFEITHFTPSDVSEQISLLMGTEDYPEVFFKAALDANKYGQEGILIPLEDLIRENAPNLCAMLDADNLWPYITNSDGHVYALPELQGVRPTNPYAMINKEWIEKLELEMPTDRESLYNVLKAFKEGDPNGNGQADEIPLATNTNVNINNLLQYFDVNFNGYYALDENDKVYFLPNTQLWYDFTEYVTRLYSEGLINQDAFTIDLDGLKAKCSAGDVPIAGMFWDYNAISYTPGATSNEDECVLPYHILPPFSEGTYPTTSGVFLGTFAVTDKCSDPAAVVAWADQFYGEEGAILAWWGVEGINYELDENGMAVTLQDENGESMMTDRYKIMGVFNHPGSRPSDEAIIRLWGDQGQLNDEINEIAKTAGKPWPVLTYTEEENEERSVLQTDIHGYLWSYFSSVVTGEQDLASTWEDYKKTLDEMGLERLMEIMASAQERGAAQ